MLISGASGGLSVPLDARDLSSSFQRQPERSFLIFLKIHFRTSVFASGGRSVPKDKGVRTDGGLAASDPAPAPHRVDDAGLALAKAHRTRSKVTAAIAATARCPMGGG